MKDFSKGPDFPELSELRDQAAQPKVLEQLKAGNVVRITVARVGDKVLDVLLTPQEASGGSEYNVSSEWALYSAAGIRTGATMWSGGLWSGRINP